ncbi:MAG: Rpn family recombination-promoting nuclease/putative transposase [Spirochaetales bacterium]
MPFSPMTHDRVFRHVFGEPGGLPILKSLINAYLELARLPTATTLELLNPDLGPESIGEKRTVLDVLVQDESGRKVNVEIQTSRKPAFLERSLFYWARLYGRQLPKGEDYQSLRPVVVINFLEYEIREEGTAIHEFRLPGTDHEVIFHVELPKFVGRSPRDLNPAEIWGKFLEEPRNKRLYRGTTVAAALKAARDRMEAYMSLTPDVVREIQQSMYEHDIATLKRIAQDEGRAQGIEQGIEQGRAQGRAQGREEGLEQGRSEGRAIELSIARKMKDEGMSQETILRLTGLALKDL